MFNDSIFIVLPSKVDILPSMCYVFELFMLKSASNLLDRVVAWGAFPACDGRFDVSQVTDAFFLSLSL